LNGEAGYGATGRSATTFLISAVTALLGTAAACLFLHGFQKLESPLQRTGQGLSKLESNGHVYFLLIGCTSHGAISSDSAHCGPSSSYV